MAEAPGNALRLLRERHESHVLGLLRANGPLSRAELARRTGLSRATLSSIISRLLTIDAVVERADAEPSARARGRPPTLLTLNPAGGLALGIDLGRRRIHVAIANVAHNIIATTSTTCSEEATVRQRAEDALALVDTLRARNHISLAALEGVGVGVVGPVAEAGAVPRRHEVDNDELVHQMVAEHFGVPAYVDNNTRLGALAEAIWGSGSGSENVLYVRMSYGIGGGLVLGGHLFAGAFGGAAEFGHVSVDPGGLPCACGGRGCLERYAGLDVILEHCHAHQVSTVFDRLRAGDEQVLNVISDAASRLGQVIAAACNVVNPEVVVVGGELADAGEFLLEPARKAIRSYTHRDVHQRLKVRAAELADDSTAMGGVALVFRRSALLAGYPAVQDVQDDATSAAG